MMSLNSNEDADDFTSVFQHWQNLKPWFNPVAIRLLMPWFAIIPILLSVFRDAPEVVVFATDPPLILRLELPFRWWLLWLASLLFALGFALFHLFCPKFVKRYANYVDYRGHEHSPRWLVAEFAIALPQLNHAQREKLFARLVEKKLAREVSIDEEPVVGKRYVRDHATIIAFDYERQRYVLEATDSARTPADMLRFQQEVFWEIFGRLANSYGPARYTIWALLAGTITLVGLAIAQSVWTVLTFLFWTA
jgi:hypothetical protein